MPELPEVETTTKELGKLLPGLKISNVWTSYDSPYFYGKNHIKDPEYFKEFKKRIIGKKIKGTSRQGKNVLIHLEDNTTILIHMKMTGHLLYGKYELKKKVWVAVEDGPLKDPFNGFIRLVFELSNGKHLVLSDVRKFAKITILENAEIEGLGPDPLSIKLGEFKDRILKKPQGKIKTVLMDQSILSGIGNIYSDEALWLSKIHPETPVSKLKESDLKELFSNTKKVLKKGISFKGDSTSDYRNPSGEKGGFQHHHRVYRLRGKKCVRKDCEGVISRTVVNGRSAHFCPVCQPNSKKE